MQVISRIQFPQTVETSDLYFKLDKNTSSNPVPNEKKISLHKGSTLSFNTYFNSVYEKFYTTYTNLNSLYYSIKLEGDFQVIAYRETDNNTQNIILNKKIDRCQLSEHIKILLPELKSDREAGRIYLEITCLSEQGLFAEGFVVTEREKSRDVSLAIITCTFKKEVYVKKTVETIVQDSFLQNKKFKIFVVDNGKTLDNSEFEDSRVQLITNRNVGGSGGFTKGLIEALKEENYTHFLFMDDDIELDSEAIYRLFALYEYTKQDFAIAGSMLDLNRKHILYEAGAIYNKAINNDGKIQQAEYTGYPLKHGLDLRDATTLNSLLLEDDIDYGGFWFFAFSKEMIEKIGLPLPLFIKTDDMEFGLRINEHFNNGIVAFPSIAVWHEPFYAKRPVWDLYYYTRNHLIANSIHNSLDYLKTVKNFTRCLLYYLFIFDYNTAQMVVKGFQDYMQGPNFIRSNDPEILHSKIFESSKVYKNQTILNSSSIAEAHTIAKVGKLQKTMSVLTLNGHLLPQFLIADKSTIIRDGIKERESICKGFAKQRIIYVVETSPTSYQYELNQKLGINILLTWLNLAIQNSFKWSSINAEWKQAFKEFTTVQFWQNYLEPEKR
jgi:galactofuranosylgalactofuranosylrhamnosyl-N-acetylglucosaminyl-diphospho-decaprenol beta-1,5/1,6-galactofuranosyltransferase